MRGLKLDGAPTKIPGRATLKPEKIIKLYSRMTFPARIHHTGSQNIGEHFGTLSGFLRNTF